MIRCALYLRLSREDGEGESNSIQSQRMLLLQYMKEQKQMECVGEWIDDGISGSHYERPGFQAMMGAAQRREFDCILCKDLSRLGREYIQTGYLRREILPRLGIRLIAVADHYDSEDTGFMEDSLLMPVMSLMNDAYCRDISRKVRWQQRTKRMMGEYIGAFACYGYQKSSEDAHVLVIDPEAAEIVRIIYLLRLGGMAAENIAGVLNMGQIKSPYEYKKMQGSHYHSGFVPENNGQKEKFWTPQTVRRILSNSMYTGVMIQGKDQKLSYKLQKRVALPKEKWICVDGVLPVIIPKWVYERIRKLQTKRIRCQKGNVFCTSFAGYGLNAKEQETAQKWLQQKMTQFPGGIADHEPWLKRLWVALFVEEIHVVRQGGGLERQGK